MDEKRQALIAKKNDAFRALMANDQARAAVELAGYGFMVGGYVRLTDGVLTKFADRLTDVFTAVANYNEFDPDDGNDPYGEHDFASFNIGGVAMFFKIDYFADTKMKYGAEDPSADGVCRVMTIMLTEEY